MRRGEIGDSMIMGATQSTMSNQALPREVVGRRGSSPRLALGIERHTTRPGEVTLEASAAHRLKVHAGEPVRGACRRQSFVTTRGDVDLFPAGTADVWHEEDASTFVMLEVSPQLMRRAADELGLDPSHAGLEPRWGLRDPQIEHIAWALDAERSAGHPSGRLYAESLGVALAIHLLGRYKSATAPTPRGLSKPQLRRLESYIEEHLDRDLSLARLADVAGVSASHLKTLFKRSTGLPVHEYVVRRRVERAKELLRRSPLPIAQVALDAGFAHPSHMARCMRRVLGVTPSAVRGDELAPGGRVHPSARLASGTSLGQRAT